MPYLASCTERRPRLSRDHLPSVLVGR